MTEVSFLPPPSSNNFFANLKGGGRVISKEGRAWRNAAGLQINTQHPKHVPGAVELDIAIQDTSRCDLDNLIKQSVDICVGHGLIEDDNPRIVRRITAYWSAEVQGCRVRITPIQQVPA